MELSEYTAALRQEVAAVTHMAGDDVARAGQMIAEALDSSIRLTLLDVLAGAAAEITARMDDADVELRLSAGDPTFVVVQGAPDLHPPVPPVPPFPPAPGDAAAAGRAQGPRRGRRRRRRGIAQRLAGPGGQPGPRQPPG